MIATVKAYVHDFCFILDSFLWNNDRNDHDHLSLRWCLNHDEYPWAAWMGPHLSYCLMVLEIHGHINQLIWIFFLMFHRVSWITGGFCVSQDFWTINSTHETGWRPYSPPRTGTHREAWEKNGKLLEFHETKTAIHVKSSWWRERLDDSKNVLFCLWESVDVGELWNVQYLVFVSQSHWRFPAPRVVQNVTNQD